MGEPIRFLRKAGAKNKGIILPIPNELTEWLQLHPGTKIVLEPREGKHGNYVIMYNGEEPEKKEETEVEGVGNDADSEAAE